MFLFILWIQCYNLVRPIWFLKVNLFFKNSMLVYFKEKISKKKKKNMNPPLPARNLRLSQPSDLSHLSDEVISVEWVDFTLEFERSKRWFAWTQLGNNCESQLCSFGWWMIFCIYTEWLDYALLLEVVVFPISPIFLTT